MFLFLPHKGIIGSSGFLAPRKVSLALIYIYKINILYKDIHTYKKNVLQEGVTKTRVQKPIGLCEIFFITRLQF